MELELVKPSEIYEESFKEMIKAYDDKQIYRYKEVQKDFKVYCVKLRASEEDGHLSGGQNKVYTYWLIKDKKQVLGVVRVQPELTTPLLKNSIGNIGFEIHPFYRHQGYGKIILHEGIKKCLQCGINPILVICSIQNKACQKVIEANSGIFKKKTYDPIIGESMLHYWIKATKDGTIKIKS